MDSGVILDEDSRGGEVRSTGDSQEIIRSRKHFPNHEVEQIMQPNSATLRSNSGDAECAITLGALLEYANEPAFESILHVRGNNWDGDETYPVTICLAGLWLHAVDLKAIRDHIEHWVSQPLGELDANDLTGQFELARLPGQYILVSFGPRDDTISYLNPVVTVFYSASAFQGEFHYVTDQTCLAMFADELSLALARVL